MMFRELVHDIAVVLCLSVAVFMIATGVKHSGSKHLEITVTELQKKVHMLQSYNRFLSQKNECVAECKELALIESANYVAAYFNEVSEKGVCLIYRPDTHNYESFSSRDVRQILRDFLRQNVREEVI